MYLKKKLYQNLVEKHSDIQKAYLQYVSNSPDRPFHRIKSWLFLLKLNLQHLVGIKPPQTTPVQANNLHYPECGIEQRPSVDELIDLLEQYDVISFDIFDTLIFRAVADPTDLFALIGNRLHVAKYKDYRVKAEKYARDNTTKPNHEINIEDIYELVSLYCGIDKQVGINAELQAEKDICFANPYMMKIVKELAKRDKQIIAVSNMYLPKPMISDLLISCGYNQFQQIFVSCDYQCSKHGGKLQKKVWDIIGSEKKVIHVGDNYNADFVGSRMIGWKAFYYKNVNQIGKPYRPANMSKLGYSVYSGLVNAKFHNGSEQYGSYYELGYAYGGILACSYCAWLNQYAKANNIDKLLFSGRDMYIVHEIYNKYYKEVDNDYILISRFAAQRFAFERFAEYFVTSHIYSRASIEKLTIGEAFKELDIQSLTPFLQTYHLSENDLLTKNCYPTIRKCIYEHKQELIKEFFSEQNAALKYYEAFVQNHQRVAVVDLGWQGTNALCLKYLLEEKSELDVEVLSVLMGASSTNGDFLSHSISSGVTSAFCFSPNDNISLLKQFNHPSYGRFLCELIFSAPEDSLKNFELDSSGNIKPIFVCHEKRSQSQLKEILQGIRDYADDFHRTGLHKNEICYSGFESILPLNKLAYNKSHVLDLLTENEVNLWIGIPTNRNATNINKYLR